METSQRKVVSPMGVMGKKFWLLEIMAGLLLFGTGLSAPPKTIQGHVLTLDVRVDGEQIMAPMVELIANAPAIIEVDGDKPGDRYRLELLLKDRQRIGKIADAISIEAQLFDGNSNYQESLTDSTLFIRPGKGGGVTAGSMHGEVSINVITHAVKVHAMSDAEHQKILAGCDPLATTMNQVSPNVDEDCCTADCGAPGSRLRCCGAIGCCS